MRPSIDTLTVWTFSAPEAADQALPRLQRLAAERLVDVDDAAVVSWPEGVLKPRTRTLGTLTGPGRLWSGFWGMLFGLIFLAPLAGPAFGAAAGAVAGTLSEFGIADDFLMRVRESVRPGTSALFALSRASVADRLACELRDLNVELIRCELSDEQTRRLGDVLVDEIERPIA